MTILLSALACALALLAGARAFRHGVPSQSPVAPLHGVLLLFLATASATSTLAVTVAPSPVRVAVVLLAILLAPGYALASVVPVDDPVDELALAVGVGVAALILGAMVMVSTGLWAPVEVNALVSVIVAPVLAYRGTQELRGHAAWREARHV